MQVQQQKTKLAVSQNRELEFQRVSEMLEIERGKIDGGGGQDEANNIESHEKTIKDFELKLADLQASYDLSDSMVSDLTRKERASNDEIEEARKVAVMVMLLTRCLLFCCFHQTGVLMFVLDSLLERKSCKNTCIQMHKMVFVPLDGKIL